MFWAHGSMGESREPSDYTAFISTPRIDSICISLYAANDGLKQAEVKFDRTQADSVEHNQFSRKQVSTYLAIFGRHVTCIMNSSKLVEHVRLSPIAMLYISESTEIIGGNSKLSHDFSKNRALVLE
jgi:hypothetical protein